MQDDSGTIWIQFKEGLAKYDGQTWEYFTPNNSPIPIYTECSTLDKEGNVWISGWTIENFGQIEVLKFDGTNWTGNSYPEQPIGGHYAQCCTDSSGNVYFTTNSSGIVKFTDTNFVFLSSTTIGLQNNFTQWVFVDSLQQLWIGHSGGVSVYDGDTTCNLIDPSSYGGGAVRAITQDIYGNMWFATNYNVAKYDGTSWALYDNLQVFGWQNVDKTSLASDSSGGIWCGTFDQGLSYFDGTTWTQFDTLSGLNSMYVTNICCEINNLTWVCTWDMGINLYDGQQWSYVNTLDGLSNNWINALECDNNGTIWFGSECGAISNNGNDWKSYVYKYRGARIKSVTKGVDNKIWFGSDGGPGFFGETYLDSIWNWYYPSWLYLQSPLYQILADIRNIVWIATSNGLDHIALASGSITQYVIYDTSNGLLHNKVRALVRSTNGDLIIGTWGGINVFDGINFTTLTIPAPEQMSNQVTSMLLDHEGKLWVGTTEGLGYYNWQNWTIYKTSEGLADNYINALYETENDSLWVATQNGISQLNGNSFASYFKADGLIADNITDIVEDHIGNLYFSSHYGVSKVDAGYLGFESRSEDNLNLYPNPAKNIITISSPNVFAEIELYSPTGQLLQIISSCRKQETLDISGLAPGNYFVRAIGKEDVWVGKFVKL
jgi:ligand-binding sensor domain-containing protein